MDKEKLKDLDRQYETFLATPGVQAACLSTCELVLKTDKFEKTRFIFDLSHGSKTDGRTVWVSLPEYELESEDKFWGTILRVLCVHECYHILCSNFKDMEKINTWFGEEIEKRGFDKKIGAHIASDFLNICEDGRIEARAIRDFPGLSIGFRIKNLNMRDDFEIEEVALDPKQEFTDFRNNVLSYAKTGYYAKGIEAYSGTRFESEFLKIVPRIDRAVFEKTSDGCLERTKEILLSCIDYFCELLSQSEELQQELSEDYEQEYQGASGTEEAGGTNRNRNEEGSDASNNVSSGNSGDSEDGDDENSSSGSPSGGKSSEEQKKPNGFGNSAKPEEKSGQKEAAANSFNSDKDKEAKKISDNENPQTDGLSKEEIEEMLETSYGGKSTRFTEVWNNVPVKPLPEHLSMKASALKRNLVKIFKERSSDSFNRRSGKVDPRTLWKYGVKRDDLFSRKSNRDLSDTCCYLLIDNSGSMMGTKSDNARTAAAIIEEALLGFLPCKIALFNTMGSKSIHTSLRAFDNKKKANYSYSSIKTIWVGDCNEDSVHINYAARELKKRKEQRKLLFVLSDGMPSAYGDKESAQAEVKKAVDNARKQGIEVISIMFGDDNFRDMYKDIFKMMYSKNIISCSPDNISEKLPEVLRRILIS